MSDGTDQTRSTRWVPSSPLDAAVAVAGLVLLGATAFGLWHVVVGGLVSGNPRAAAFGVALAFAAGIPLIVGTVVVRRRRHTAR